MLKTAHAMQISPGDGGSHSCQENACSRAALIAVNLGSARWTRLLHSPSAQAHAEKRLAGEEGLDVTDWDLARNKLATAAE